MSSDMRIVLKDFKAKSGVVLNDVEMNDRVYILTHYGRNDRAVLMNVHRYNELREKEPVLRCPHCDTDVTETAQNAVEQSRQPLTLKPLTVPFDCPNPDCDHELQVWREVVPQYRVTGDTDGDE